ncbi:GTPase [Candidatus Vidania fulgoroideorum]
MEIYTEKDILKVSDIKKYVKKKYIKNLNFISIKQLNKISKKNKFILLKKKKKIIYSIIGEVDSGKTTIIRNLTGKKINEYKDITQDIKVYKIKKGYILDTPGHNFFNSLRKKIINISDIIYIVVDKENCNIFDILKYIKKKKKKAIFIINKKDLFDYNNLFKKLKILEKTYAISALFDKDISHILEVNFNNKNKGNFGYVLNTIYSNKNGFYHLILLKSGIIKLGDFINDDRFFLGKVKKIKKKNKFYNRLIGVDLIKLYGINNNVELGKKIFFEEFKKNQFLQNNLLDIFEYSKKQKIFITSNNYNFLYNLEKFFKNKYIIVGKKIGFLNEIEIKSILKKNTKIINWGSFSYKNNNIINIKSIYDLYNINFERKKSIEILKIIKKNIFGALLLKNELKIDEEYNLYRKNFLICKVKIKSIRCGKKKLKIFNKKNGIFGVSFYKKVPVFEGDYLI